MNSIVYHINSGDDSGAACKFAINPPNELYDEVFFSAVFYPTRFALTAPWYRFRDMLDQFEPHTQTEAKMKDMIQTMLDQFYRKHNLNKSGHAIHIPA